jgi:hypothetical protein
LLSLLFQIVRIAAVVCQQHRIGHRNGPLDETAHIRSSVVLTVLENNNLVNVAGGRAADEAIEKAVSSTRPEERYSMIAPSPCLISIAPRRRSYEAGVAKGFFRDLDCRKTNERTGVKPPGW